MLFGPQPDRRTWAIALVHGIGTTQPLDMIHDVSEAIKGPRPDFVLSEDAEIRGVPKDKEELDRHEARRPRHVHVRSGALGNEKVRIGTAHWADVSYYREGIISLIGILLMAAFGVRFFANVATQHRLGTPLIVRFFSTIVRFLLTAMTVVLAVLVFPVTFASLIYSSIGVMAEYTIRYRGDLTAPLQIAMIAAGGLFVTSMLAHTGLTRIASMRKERSLGIWIFLSMFLIAIIVSAGIFATATSLPLWQKIMTSHASGSAWLLATALAALVMIAVLVTQLVTSIRKKRLPGALVSFFSALVLAIALAAVFSNIPDTSLPLYLKQHMIEFAKKILMNDHLGARIEIADDIGVFFALFNVVESGLGIVMLTLTSLVTVGLFFYVLFAKLFGRTASTMIFAVVSVVSIWLALMLLLWPHNLANHSAMSGFIDQKAADDLGCIEVETLQGDTVAESLQSWFSSGTMKRSILVGKDDLKSLECTKLPADRTTATVWKYGQVARPLGDTYPISWFEMAYQLFIVACAAIFFIIFSVRSIWIRARRKGNLDGFAPATGALHPKRQNWPRLIVARSYMVAVLVFAFGVTCIFSYFAVMVAGPMLAQLGLTFADGLAGGYGSQVIRPEVTINAEYVRFAVIVFVVVFVISSTYMANGLKLVLDVVNHFTQPAAGYPVRKRIADRFHEIVDFLIEPCKTKPELVIIAHSQGTIITLDALRDKEWVDRVLARVASLTVITVGSPVTHVYQRYFPREYPELASDPNASSTYQSKAKTDLKILAADPRVRWINAYRIDDYVGTYIENSIPNFPVNVPLPPGGHMRYWSKDVMQRIFDTPAIKDVLLRNAQA